MNNDRLKFRTPVYDIFGNFIYFVYWVAGESKRPPLPRKLSLYKYGRDEQCTALHDKNGNLIYDGDNVQFTQKRGYYTDKGDVCTIEFGTFRFCGFGWRSRPENTVDFALTESAAKKCVIVGNIHEQKDKQ